MYYSITGFLVFGLDYVPVISRSAVTKRSAEMMVAVIKSKSYVGLIRVQRGENVATYMKKEEEWHLVEVNGESLI